jgi:hypothetical protein
MKMVETIESVETIGKGVSRILEANGPEAKTHERAPQVRSSR